MDLRDPDFQMIQEGYRRNPGPLWLWLALLAILVSFYLAVSSFYQGYTEDQKEASPFFRVTNREFSLFLWCNPEFMRVNARRKQNYLPAFQYQDKVTVEPHLADRLVDASPQILFFYHVWSRQIRDQIPLRSILADEFLEFVTYAEEWQPIFWSLAPEGYKELIGGLPELGRARVDELLSFEVRLAFQGWKNYMKEGEAINAVRVSAEELDRFLVSYPHYARHYWKNIVGDQYLKTYSKWELQGSVLIPEEEITSFLKLALYNFQRM